MTNAKERVTTLEFQDWFGGDHCERWQDLTELILELLNGIYEDGVYTEYSIDSLRKDIKSYAEGSDTGEFATRDSIESIKEY